MRTAAMVFTLAGTFACGGSGAVSDPRADAPERTPAGSTAQAGDSACDRYVRMVSRCIETKMPESERASERQELEYVRQMVAASPVARQAAEKSCEETIRHEIRHDRYGCYEEEAAQAGIQTACSLLTRHELEALLQAPLEQGTPDGTECVYASAGPPLRSLKLTVHWTEGREQLEAARAGTAMVNQMLRGSTGETAAPGVTIDGLGDDAFFVMAGFVPMLYARSGDTAIGLETVGATREQTIEIARRVLERIKR
jgi:hypothetical protein